MGQQLVTLEVLDNGHLRMAVVPGQEEEVRRIAEAEYPSAARIALMLEYPLGNGWSLLTPEEAGGLTSCELILSDEVTYDAEGAEVASVGRVWWWPQYETTDPMERLAETGAIILTRAD